MAGTFNQSLQCTQDVFVGFQAPSPPVEATHDCIDRRSEETRLLKNRVVDLKALSGLQQTTLQSCQNTIAGLEETVAKLTVLVTKLEKSVCRC